MITFTTKLTATAGGQTYGRLALPFDQRQKRRLRARLVSGEEVAVMLPPGATLRGGDVLAADDGRLIEVVAAPERLLHVECATPEQLLRAAYHLGNRHVPVQVGAGFLRLLQDHVLEQMLHALGAQVRHLEAPFEPEAGAYSGAQPHSYDARYRHRARIHEYK